MAAKTDFPLKYPVEIEGHDTVTSVGLRRLLAKDLRAVEGLKAEDDDTMNATFKMLSVISGLPVAVFEEMDADDFMDLMEIATDFLPGKASKPDTPASGAE